MSINIFHVVKMPYFQIFISIYINSVWIKLISTGQYTGNWRVQMRRKNIPHTSRRIIHIHNIICIFLSMTLELKLNILIQLKVIIVILLLKYQWFFYYYYSFMMGALAHVRARESGSYAICYSVPSPWLSWLGFIYIQSQYTYTHIYYTNISGLSIENPHYSKVLKNI